MSIAATTSYLWSSLLLSRSSTPVEGVQLRSYGLASSEQPREQPSAITASASLRLSLRCLTFDQRS